MLIFVYLNHCIRHSGSFVPLEYYVYLCVEYVSLRGVPLVPVPYSLMGSLLLGLGVRMECLSESWSAGDDAASLGGLTAALMIVLIVALCMMVVWCCCCHWKRITRFLCPNNKFCGCECPLLVEEDQEHKLGTKEEQQGHSNKDSNEGDRTSGRSGAGGVVPEGDISSHVQVGDIEEVAKSPAA